MAITESSFSHLRRHAQARVEEALSDTRIVAIVGPRQSGKTTLARQFASARQMTFVTLDDAQSRAFALEDPSGFIRGLNTAVIDEIQRAPELILALKRTADEDPRPGRFLITGSVDLFRGTLSPDSLAGRVETIELLPFSQTEIAGLDVPSFLDRLFAKDFSSGAIARKHPTIEERIVAGGYPEVISRKTPQRQRAWLRAYASAIAERDVLAFASVARPSDFMRLLQHAAVVSGQLLNLSALANAIGADSKTVERWLSLLEQMFILRRIPAWHRNDLKRLLKTPKLHFIDSGLLTTLRRMDAENLRSDRTKLGPILESFVYSELAKLATLSPDLNLSHYRDKDQVEVDFVLELEGRVVGIEVKASATAKPEDFRGLRKFKAAAGSAFACGVLLHDGERIHQLGDDLFAIPFEQLWTT